MQNGKKNPEPVAGSGISDNNHLHNDFPSAASIRRRYGTGWPAYEEAKRAWSGANPGADHSQYAAAMRRIARGEGLMMKLRIKDFSKFQHFKDRSPPWVKLYRDILDDPDWHELDGDSAKILVMLWLIASEDETKQGLLPDVRKLCFRLRINEKVLEQSITKLSHWLERVDIATTSGRYQPDAPERAGEETEKSRGETEHCSLLASESADDGFASFWEQYPKKVAKPRALKAWKKMKPSGQVLADLMAGLEKQKASADWQKEGGRFIPYPASWLNGRRWEDEIAEHSPSVPVADHKPKAGDTRARHGITETFNEVAGWVPA